MVGTIDLFLLQPSSRSCVNITFCSASHHFGHDRQPDWLQAKTWH